MPEQISNNSSSELDQDIKELSETLKESARSQDRFSEILVVLALVQIVVGLFQFILAAQNSQISKWYGLGWVLLLIATISWVLFSFRKRSQKRKANKTTN
ncbi:MAG: hypothetical protein JWO40_868 [Candidatus Doudnabacteria bacterium]|nr:hypothetical protein [Candidatus Doudnabacteria bacterium]